MEKYAFKIIFIILFLGINDIFAQVNCIPFSYFGKKTSSFEIQMNGSALQDSVTFNNNTLLFEIKSNKKEFTNSTILISLTVYVLCPNSLIEKKIAHVASLKPSFHVLKDQINSFNLSFPSLSSYKHRKGNYFFHFLILQSETNVVYERLMFINHF